jgi:archaemetzincin
MKLIEKRFLIFTFFSSMVLFAACRENQTMPVATHWMKTQKQQMHIKVLPLGPTNKSHIKQAVSALEKYAGPVTLLEKQDLPTHAFYAPRNRYRADKLIQWMAAKADRGEVFIGLTSSDISTTKGSIADFGVMGLGYRPGRACIVSSFRLRNKSNFYKVVLHEAAHTSGLPHCPVSTCFLRDAKGGDPTGEETGFCNACAKYLKRKGWAFNRGN